MRTIKQQARIAGWWYLALAISAPLGLLVVPGKLLVSGNAAATAEKLRTQEGLLRLGIGSELLHQVVVIFVVLALYRLFKPTDEYLAKQVVILGALVSVPIMFVNVLNDVAALTFAKDPDYLAVFDRGQLDALAYLFTRLHATGITIASIFWGLWLIPLGRLIVRSGFIPRILGYLLYVAGAAYLAEAFGQLVMPQLKPYISPWSLPAEMAELPIILWLATWGARGPKAAEQV